MTLMNQKILMKKFKNYMILGMKET